jgi:hypothetical protein
MLEEPLPQPLSYEESRVVSYNQRKKTTVFQSLSPTGREALKRSKSGLQNEKSGLIDFSFFV